MNLTDTELAYLAGIIDGEGHIGVHEAGTTVAIQVTNTSKELMDWLLSKLGGNVAPREKLGGHKQLWVWSVYDKKHMRFFVDEVAPYSLLKKEHLKVMDEWLSYSPGRGTPLTEEQELGRAICAVRMKHLNKRGD